MKRTKKINQQLAALAAHFAARRKNILQAWVTAIKNDPELPSAATLSRSQLYDHIPDVLDDYQARLDADSGIERAEAEQESCEDAAVHGLHRWQQGYQLREVIREWGYLHLCLMEELETYALSHQEAEPAVMAFARRTLLQLCNEGASESTGKYFQLRQAEAAGHVKDMQQTLEQVHELQRRRAELWRQAAHDLRGNLGIVKNATHGLSQDGIPEPLHDEFLRLLQKSVGSLHTMLDEVINLARLEAGQESREIKPYDATLVLKEVCEYLQPMASERGLFLKLDGPASLAVEGDPGKIKRIVQNLLLNALKYTHSGGVTLSWGAQPDDARHWKICVRDTGPGFHAGPGAPLAAELKEATRQMHQAAVDQEPGQQTGDRVIAPSDQRPVHQEQGEGIGLSIVKRLCEILDASIELDSSPDQGTTFCVILPRSYDSTKTL